MSDHWTESHVADSVLEQERDNADQRDWDNELERDRQILLEDPPPRKKAV